MFSVQSVKNLKNKQPQNDQEEGFTLLEIIIAVIIIGVLASISFLMAGEQQRNAIVATVKSDVYSNKDVMAPGAGQRLYAQINKFAQSANNTDKNVTFYTINPQQTEACTHSTRTFDTGDVVVYRFLTSVGRLEPLYCPDLGGGSTQVGSDGVTNTTPPTTAPPTTGGGTTIPGGSTNPTPAPTGNPSNSDGGYGTDPIRPGNGVTTIKTIMTSNETYRVCYNVQVNTTSTTGAPWSVFIDKTVAPFTFGNFIEGLTDSRYRMTDQGNNYLLYGTDQMQNASTNNTVSPSFCVKAPNNLPVIPTKIDSLIASTGSVSGGMYNATQNFTVRNSSQYYSGWTAEVDLSALKNTVTGKPGSEPFTDTDVKIEKVSNNIYRISSSISYRSIKQGNDYTLTVRLG